MAEEVETKTLEVTIHHPPAKKTTREVEVPATLSRDEAREWAKDVFRENCSFEFNAEDFTGCEHCDDIPAYETDLICAECGERRPMLCGTCRGDGPEDLVMDGCLCDGPPTPVRPEDFNGGQNDRDN